MFKFRKKYLIVVLIISIMSLVFSGCGKKQGEIVAKVNGDVITQEEFDREFEMAKKIKQKQFGEDILFKEMGNNKVFEDVLREETLDILIEDKLIRQELDRLNITLTDEEIDRAIKTRYIDELGGEEEYKAYLENNGFTEEFFRQQLERILLFEKYAEYYFDKIELSEKELKDYFEKNKDSLIKVKASHILVPTEEEGKKVLEKLKKGEDFYSLAATESMDEDSAVKGGAIEDGNYFTRGEMLESYKEIENVIFQLNIGEISDLVKSELGYHIILLEDKIDTYEELKEDVIIRLKNEKYMEELSNLKNKAKIKIYMDLNKKK